jgi:formate dehydrogenase subunit beta
MGNSTKQNTEAALRKAAKKLFADNTIQIVIGYRNGSLPNTARPFFARTADDAEKLVWNRFCSGNLAALLPRLFEKPQKPPEGYKPPRVAIVAKGCDARSVAGLVKEKQVARENVIVIGMPCEGMLAAPKGDASAEELLRACAECVSPQASEADITIEGRSRKVAKPSYAKVKEFEKKSAVERWRVFTEEITRCIRCNACREACPNCYCKVCFADQRKPAWVSPAAKLSDTMVYHIGRMFHQAGRCVECDACVNACPMGIDLRLFTQKVAADAFELFGCIPGVSGDDVPPLQTFKQDDSECFITDPEEQ